MNHYVTNCLENIMAPSQGVSVFVEAVTNYVHRLQTEH